MLLIFFNSQLSKLEEAKKQVHKILIIIEINFKDLNKKTSQESLLLLSRVLINLFKFFFLQIMCWNYRVNLRIRR
jgi:hypothetical protein